MLLKPLFAFVQLALLAQRTGVLHPRADLRMTVRHGPILVNL